MDSDKGHEVKAHYLAVGRRMRAYSASLHKQWFETVDAQLIALLRRTLLVVPFQIQQHGSGAVVAADISGIPLAAALHIKYTSRVRVRFALVRAVSACAGPVLFLGSPYE